MPNDCWPGSTVLATQISLGLVATYSRCCLSAAQGIGLVTVGLFSSRIIVLNTGCTY